jgi:hypothetical protein
MEGKWTSTKNSMVYIAAHAFPDEDYQYKDNRDYNCNDLQCSHHKKQQILLFMRSTASRWSRNRQRCPWTKFSDIELCSSLHIMSMFMPKHYIFYTFCLSINRLQESWFFHNANSTQNYTQCNLGNINLTGLNEWMYVRVQHNFSSTYLFYTTTLHVVTLVLLPAPHVDGTQRESDMQNSGIQIINIFDCIEHIYNICPTENRKRNIIKVDAFSYLPTSHRIWNTD